MVKKNKKALKSLAEIVELRTNRSATLLAARDKKKLAQTSLDKVRTIAWFRTVCEQAGALGFTDSDLTNRFDHTKWPNGLISTDWRRYARGQQKPNVTTLKNVEKAFKGTLKIFEDGPMDMWAILSGDIAACTALINQEVSRVIEPKLLDYGLAFSKKVKAFEKLLVSPGLMKQYEPFASLTKDDEAVNAVALTYLMMKTREDVRLPPPAAPMSPSLMLSTIALSQVATHQYECFIEANYLMFGLCSQATYDMFPLYGDLIGEYLYRQFHWRSTSKIGLRWNVASLTKKN